MPRGATLARSEIRCGIKAMVTCWGTTADRAADPHAIRARGDRALTSLRGAPEREVNARAPGRQGARAQRFDHLFATWRPGVFGLNSARLMWGRLPVQPLETLLVTGELRRPYRGVSCPPILILLDNRGSEWDQIFKGAMTTAAAIDR